jgi:small subunit ribosomal protein S8e
LEPLFKNISLLEYIRLQRKIFKPTFNQEVMDLGKKITGGRYHAYRKSKKHELPGIPRKVVLKTKKTKILRMRGGAERNVLLTCDVANILDKKGKSKKAKIKNVVETKANRFLARQNIMVKGAIIDTDLGKARITNRPGQEGSINAVLTEEQ